MLALQAAELGDGEAVKAMRPSLDASMLAVQRSPAFLQFLHIRSSNMFVQVYLISWDSAGNTNHDHKLDIAPLCACQ